MRDAVQIAVDNLMNHICEYSTMSVDAVDFSAGMYVQELCNAVRSQERERCIAIVEDHVRMVDGAEAISVIRSRDSSGSKTVTEEKEMTDPHKVPLTYNTIMASMDEYARAYGEAVLAEERARLRDIIMAKHEAANGQHNLYHCLAVELFGY